MKISLKMVAVIAIAVFTAGCVSEEGVKISGDIAYAVGSDNGNQPTLQKISWNVNVSNTGDTTAQNVTADVILHPKVLPRLMSFEEETVLLGDLPPQNTIGFNGTAKFNVTGLDKDDIASWQPLVKIRVTWTEDGRVIEKILPEAGQ